MAHRRHAPTANFVSVNLVVVAVVVVRQIHPSAPRLALPIVGLRVPFYVAETSKKAYSEPRESTLNSMRRLGERVAGYADTQGTTGNWGAQGERILEMEYDDWIRDKVIFGTPDAVVDKIKGLIEELGLDQIMYEINYGNLIPYDRQINSLKLITQEVLPQVR